MKTDFEICKNYVANNKQRVVFNNYSKGRFFYRTIELGSLVSTFSEYRESNGYLSNKNWEIKYKSYWLNLNKEEILEINQILRDKHNTERDKNYHQDKAELYSLGDNDED